MSFKLQNYTVERTVASTLKYIPCTIDAQLKASARLTVLNADIRNELELIVAR